LFSFYSDGNEEESEYSAAVIAVWNIAMADNMSALGFEIQVWM
jgi:hypothetical protein